MIQPFESSTLMVAFLFQLFEYGGEISHAEILAGHRWCKTAPIYQQPQLGGRHVHGLFQSVSDISSSRISCNL